MDITEQAKSLRPSLTYTAAATDQAPGIQASVVQVCRSSNAAASVVQVCRPGNAAASVVPDMVSMHDKKYSAVAQYSEKRVPSYKPA